MIKFKDGSECPTVEEYFAQLEEEIKRLKEVKRCLREQLNVERQVSAGWFERYMKLKHEMQREPED